MFIFTMEIKRIVVGVNMNEFLREILSVKKEESCIFSLGQAGFVFRNKKRELLGVDLYLSDCVERIEGHEGFKRLLPKILYPQDIRFDYLIATHPHFDHFDMDSIPLMMANGSTKLWASVNCKAEVKRLMMSEKNIFYVQPGENTQAGDFYLEFVDCDHGIGAPDAFGIIITVDEKKIYIAGDTCLRIDTAEQLKSRGTFDVMIAPINGAYGNLNEKECAQLCDLLNPKVIIPCHYGMFASHGGNPGLFYEIMKQEYSDKKFLLMTMGEKYVL